MKILIVGAGVAGCAFAGFSNKYDLGEVTLVERSRYFGNTGYVIVMWPNGRKVLSELGIARQVVDEQGFQMRESHFENARGRILKNLSFDDFESFGKTSVIARADLQSALVSKFSRNTRVKLGTTIRKIQQLGDKVAVDFSDDTSDVFDLVVGADGINSSVREMVFGSGFKKFYGWGVWTYWLPQKFKVLPRLFQSAAKSKFYAIMPLHDRANVFFIARIAKDGTKPPDKRIGELRRLFRDFNPQAREILEAMPSPENIFYDDLASIDIKDWYKGRVALMGDAQHAFSPLTGLGASLALEDAFVLASELKQASSADEALWNYSKRRIKRIKKFHNISSWMDAWTISGGFLEMSRNLLLPFTPSWLFLRPMRKLMEGEI